MIVSLSEFKSDLERYFELVDNEEIVITNGGKCIATLLGPAEDAPSGKTALIHSLIGTLPSTVTVEEARKERLVKHEIGL